MSVALVLGGGGPVGIAWECGVLMGLADAGVDLGRFQRVVGTSAGSIVGAHVAVNAAVEELYAAHNNPLPAMRDKPNLLRVAQAFGGAKLLHWTVEGQRRSLGRSAQEAAVPGAEEWVDWIGHFLPAGGQRWPLQSELLVTAVDARAGQLRVFRSSDGVALGRAVAASCAVPCVFPLVPVGERLYMDGGMGSPTNALLAHGCERVLVLDPLLRSFSGWTKIKAEAKELERAGSRVHCLTFDDRCHAVVGRNFVDLSRTAELAARAREQGRAEAARVREVLAAGV